MEWATQWHLLYALTRRNPYLDPTDPPTVPPSELAADTGVIIVLRPPVVASASSEPPRRVIPVRVGDVTAVREDGLQTTGMYIHTLLALFNRVIKSTMLFNIANKTVFGR